MKNDTKRKEKMKFIFVVSEEPTEFKLIKLDLIKSIELTKKDTNPTQDKKYLWIQFGDRRPWCVLPSHLDMDELIRFISREDAGIFTIHAEKLEV